MFHLIDKSVAFFVLTCFCFSKKKKWKPNQVPRPNNLSQKSWKCWKIFKLEKNSSLTSLKVDNLYTIFTPKKRIHRRILLESLIMNYHFKFFQVEHIKMVTYFCCDWLLFLLGNISFRNNSNVMYHLIFFSSGTFED